jgi:hypothetical protein
MRYLLRHCMWLFLLFMPVDSATAAESGGGDAKPLGVEELEQLVAPVALYPDSLLAQLLMASTYPLEVVEAARWSKENPKISGAELDAAMQKQNWDASVKSLAAFPDVLTMMNDKLDWTEKLGDAFLAQQKDVMDAVQRLRAKAKAQGNLSSGKEQRVSTTTGSGGTDVIVIQPSSPEVVYVPTYNPTIVYGVWPYPSYPPYAWYPPGYAASNVLSFGLGVAAGAAMWGDFDWGHDEVNINVNNYQNYTRNTIPDDWKNNGGRWKHDPDHRRGVPYDNHNVDKRFRGDDQARDQARARAREEFRGHGGSGAGGLHPGGNPGRQPLIDGRGEHRTGERERMPRDGGRERPRHDQPRREHQMPRDRSAFHLPAEGGREHFDSARGAGSRGLQREHPGGGGFHPAPHGGGMHRQPRR